MAASDDLSSVVARKSDDIRVIREITLRIGATLALDRILELSLEVLEESLGFKHSMILLVETDQDVLVVKTSRGYAESGIDVKVPIGQGVLGVVARRRRITRPGSISAQRAYIANVRRQMQSSGEGATLEAIPDLPGLPDADSQIGIPLLVQDRLVGVLGVESPAPRAFDELDEMLLTIIGSHLAHAIENARLHTAAIERTRALDAANAELSRLNETLEKSVAERTAELSSALIDMQREKDLREDLLRRMAPPAVIPLMLEERLTARHLYVTILFADIEGFTAYSGDMEPDEVFSHINHFFSWAGEVIERYRGYISKTSGDGIMALFGVPFESSTHQTDAVLAALSLQSELHDLFPFNIRIGISSGIVTAGMLGAKNKSVYDVLGDAVNVASRMQDLCPVGGIVVPESAEALRAYFLLDSLGELPVKGKGIMSCARVRGIKPLMADNRRVDPSSVFARDFASVVDEIEALKRERLAMIDFPSIQARDVALHHNEAVAAFGLALLRFLKLRHPELAQGVDERRLVLMALLHDLGKHAIDAERLNRPSLSHSQRDALRNEMCVETLAVLDQLGVADLAATIEGLYRFEKARGASGEFDTTVEIIAVCDIYDALTAPKRYKGAPWQIPGALAELKRLPWCQIGDRPVVDAFVELMKSKDSEVYGGGRARVVLR